MFVVHVTAYLLCTVIGLLWYIGRSTFDHWRKLGIVYKKSPVAFLGNLADYALQRKTFDEAFDDLYAYFDGHSYGGIWLMRQPTLFIRDTNLIHDILVTDFKYFCDRGLGLFVHYDRKLNPLSCNLFTAKSDRWRFLRSKIGPSFGHSKLRLMYQQMIDCVAKLSRTVNAKMVDDRKSTAVVEVRELFDGFTLDVIGSYAFGLAVDVESSNGDDSLLRIKERFNALSVTAFEPRLETIFKVLFASIDKRLLDLFRLRDQLLEVTEFFINIVSNTIASRKRLSIRREDILQLLMELQETRADSEAISNNEQFDDIDIAANLFLLVVAGYETTAATLSHCLYELSLNPKLQEKIREEVIRVRNTHGNEADSLKELVYMDMVIKETLRKYPPGAILNRQCTIDYTIPNTQTTIAAGTHIVIPIWSIHHDSNYYPNPELFDPDRFLPDEDEQRPRGTYMPFGDGPRYCIGKRFADMEMKAALSDMLLKYNFTACNKTEIPLKFAYTSFVARPRNGIWLKISKREL